LVGCTFYGIFASGELQPWAEPAAEEQKVWAPPPGAITPASFEEIERPPLRKIDKYCKAECPCMPARYTIATMACVGFMIAFGMRCNMSAAKLKGEHNGVSTPRVIIYLQSAQHHELALYSA